VVSSIPSQNLNILQGSERAIKWEFDPYTTTAEWTLTAILLRIEMVPFAEGSFRKAYHCVDLSLPPYENKYAICVPIIISQLYFLISLFSHTHQTNTSKRIIYFVHM